MIMGRESSGVRQVNLQLHYLLATGRRGTPSRRHVGAMIHLVRDMRCQV